jgi:glycolate oxidase FAD binding subunit
MARSAERETGSAVTAVAADSVAALRERIVDARQRGVPLRIAGRGTWLDAGRPVRSTEMLSTRELAGITEYVPGDLVLTARAGTTLGEIRDATRAHGQWLALDPAGSDNGTIGATVATASAGPLRSFFGAPRDLVLGLEFVSGAGVVARGGGRVVKNVAGFDLTRLLTGSWGTLGVITEVTVRLHARPEADESVAVSLDPSTGATRVRQLLRRLPFTPYACEIVNNNFVNVPGGAGVTALFRLGGNAESVRAQRESLAELGAVSEVEPSVWSRLAGAEPAGSLVFRLSGLPTELDRIWGEATAIAAQCPGTLLHATGSRGVVRCIVPSEAESVAAVRQAFSLSTKSRRVGERLPGELWSVCSPSPVRDRLSTGIKRTFDPDNVLNAGILGEPA